MKKQPLISVIMPCYNEAPRIKDTVASVFQQTWPNIELIIVDDGSTDNSVEVLTKLAGQYTDLHFHPQKNRGAGPARNAALQFAHGEFIAFLDADDTWEPDCLEKLHNAFIEIPDTTIAYCGWQNLGVPENRGQPFVPPDYENEDKLETLLRGCRWPIHAALTRKAAIDAVNGFDEQWSSSMDYDLWLRIASFNKITLVPEVLAYYHHHEGEQITKNILRIALNHHEIQKHFIQKHPNIIPVLGKKKIRDILGGELLHKAYASYWERDLKTAQALFRKVFKHRYYTVKDLKYILPALLPSPLYSSLVTNLER